MVPKVGGVAAGGAVGFAGGMLLSKKVYHPFYYLGLTGAPDLLKIVFNWSTLFGLGGAVAGYFVGKKLGKCR
jgi:hypothetical protein